ncbi:hypothetical protein [Nonomuraea wenchangensis]|uniref:hypothetical protein n=1 Tax=Nonomuraea wenchangensis TaxID=568860 RepID=UPI00331CDFCF
MINDQVRAAPRWRELTWGEGPQVRAHSPADLIATARAEIAQQAVDLFGGPGIAELRACHAPGCGCTSSSGA